MDWSLAGHVYCEHMQVQEYFQLQSLWSLGHISGCFPKKKRSLEVPFNIILTYALCHQDWVSSQLGPVPKGDPRHRLVKGKKHTPNTTSLVLQRTIECLILFRAMKSQSVSLHFVIFLRGIFHN